jgi:hypothetical protein
MEKTYYVDVYFGGCPNSRKQMMGKKYYALFESSEMGAAKGAGLITYTCNHCEVGSLRSGDA